MRKSCWQPASSSLYAPHYKTVTPPYNHNWILITVSGNIQAHGVKLQHSNLLNRFLHPTLCRGTSIFQSATLAWHSICQVGQGESLTQGQAGGQARDVEHAACWEDTLCLHPQGKQTGSEMATKDLNTGRDSKD